MIFALLVVIGFVWYVMNPDERKRILRGALTVPRRLNTVVSQHRPKPEPFQEVLRTRTPRAFVASVLAGVNAAVFLGMLFGEGSLGNPDTLIAWGGSFGPLTTHGEGWRLLTMMFVHASLLALLVHATVLLQTGLLVERLVGPLVFAGAYLASGLAASVVNLWARPVAVSIGASGAIFGVYGLLVASAINGFRRPSDLTIPAKTLARLAPGAALFVLYNMWADGLEPGARLTGLVTGLVFGFLLARDAAEQKPSGRRLVYAGAAAAVIAVVSAVSLRGVTDVRPEMARVVAFEEDTSNRYDHSVELFTKGRISAAELAHVIDRTIVPELRKLRARLSAIEGVPPQHQGLVASAEQYLELRDRSWRLRSEALHQHNMGRLREADQAERASLRALEELVGNLH